MVSVGPRLPLSQTLSLSKGACRKGRSRRDTPRLATGNPSHLILERVSRPALSSVIPEGSASADPRSLSSREGSALCLFSDWGPVVVARPLYDG